MYSFLGHYYNKDHVSVMSRLYQFYCLQLFVCHCTMFKIENVEMFALTQILKTIVYTHEAIVATLLVFVDFITNFSWISTRDPALTSGSWLNLTTSP